MTKYLWTGESEYCICSHHLSKHYTKDSIQSVFGDFKTHYGCNYYRRMGYDNKGMAIYAYCKCNGFRPYMVEGGGEYR